MDSVQNKIERMNAMGSVQSWIQFKVKWKGQMPWIQFKLKKTERVNTMDSVQS